MQAERPARKHLRRDAQAVMGRCAGWSARAAARRITRFLELRMASCGLSVAQFGLMALVASAEDDTLGALARRAELDPSSLSRNLDALARLGLVEIVLIERDRRRRAVWLTEAGATRLEAAIPIWAAAHRALEDELDVTLAHRLAAAAQALSLEDRGGPAGS
jgi:DNA-binding MarR family transcriptional regulator